MSIATEVQRIKAAADMIKSKVYELKLRDPNNIFTQLTTSDKLDAHARAINTLSKSAISKWNGWDWEGYDVSSDNGNLNVEYDGRYQVDSGLTDYFNIYGPPAPQSLAEQTPGTATSGTIFKDETAWVDGQLITGTYEQPPTYETFNVNNPYGHGQEIQVGGKVCSENIIIEPSTEYIVCENAPTNTAGYDNGTIWLVIN